MSDQYDPRRPGGEDNGPWGAPASESSSASGPFDGAQGSTQGGATASSSYGSAYPENSWSATSPSYSEQAAQPGTYGMQTGYGPSAYGQGGYGVAPQRPQGLAITALVLGILSLLGFWIPVLGAVLGLVAIVLGVVALSKVKKGTGGGRGMAIAGIVTGVLGLLANLAISAVIGLALNAAGNSGALDGIMECAQLPESQRQACIEQLSPPSDPDLPNGVQDEPGT